MLLACPDIDINGYDGTKGPALVAASIQGHVEVVKELLKDVNIDPNKVSKGGGTPLGVATWMGNLEVIEELLWDARVDPNSKNNAGSTALIQAVKSMQIEAIKLETIKLLLRCPRTDTTLTNNQGKTALDLATGLGEAALVHAIQSRPTLLAEGHTCANEQGELK